MIKPLVALCSNIKLQVAGAKSIRDIKSGQNFRTGMEGTQKYRIRSCPTRSLKIFLNMT